MAGNGYNYGGPAADPNYWRYVLSQPPTTAYGADFYINQLLMQGGMPPGDKFVNSLPAGTIPKKQSTLDTITKWSAVALAGVLAFVGLKNFAPKLFK